MGADWAPCGLAHPAAAGGTAVSDITDIKNVFLFLGIKGHAIFFFFFYFFFFIAQFRLHSSSIESGFRYRVKWGNNTYENSQVCTYKIVLKCLYRVLLTFSYPL